MAHENINDRREAVRLVIEDGTFSRAVAHELAARFKATYTAVQNDRIFLTRGNNLPVFATPALKQRIFERDGFTCQYCEATEVPLVADHVVPYAQGGPACDYNLVAACNSCNARKKGRVAIPRNYNHLCEINPEWGAKIKAMYFGPPAA